MKNNKEIYESPILDITRFAIEDIITTSSTPNRPSDNENPVTPDEKEPEIDVKAACYQDAESGKWFNGTECDCTLQDLGCLENEHLE